MSSRRRLLSLDLATRLGWAFGDAFEGEPVSGSYLLPSTGDDIGAYLKAYHLWLIAHIAQFKPDIITMEAPLAATTKTTQTTLLKLWGLCSHTEFVASFKGVPCRQVHVGEWRSAFCGKGNGRISKPKTVAQRDTYPVIQSCRQRGWHVTDDNEADALGQWVYSIRFVCPGREARFDPLARGRTTRAPETAGALL